MFRNAEYVVALKDIMKIRRGASVEEFKSAFDRLDVDNSGYIEAREIDGLLADVYDGAAPAFEVKTFLRFFDVNRDGKISWEEFERGLGAMNAKPDASITKALPAFGMSMDENGNVVEDEEGEEDDEDDEDPFGEPKLSGKFQISSFF